MLPRHCRDLAGAVGSAACGVLLLLGLYHFTDKPGRQQGTR